MKKKLAVKAGARGRAAARTHEKGPKSLTSFSTTSRKSLDSGVLVSTSRKTAELTIEAMYDLRVARAAGQAGQTRHAGQAGHAGQAAELGSSTPDEGERARLIRDISRVVREPQLPETTRTACLTLIGWLARRMPGEAAHALGVAEARSELRQSERRLRAAQPRKR